MEIPIFYYTFLWLISRAFQNIIIKLRFIEYFPSYEALRQDRSLIWPIKARLITDPAN